MKDINLFPFERNKYFYGKLLTVRDFETEQRYFNNKRRILNRTVVGAGVITGMSVSAGDDSTLMIESGIALDYLGSDGLHLGHIGFIGPFQREVGIFHS